MYFKTSKFFLYASVFFVALVSTSTLFPFIVGKYSWFRLTIDIALIAFLLGLVLDPRAEYFQARLTKLFSSPLFWAVSTFTVIFVLAGLFGIDPSLSFWSNFERGEGGLQVIHLFLLFMLLAVLFESEKDWQRIFLLSLVAAMLVVFYGVGAWLKYVDAEFVEGTKNFSGQGGPFYNTFRNFFGPGPGERFSGSIGNPAYTAAYLMFAIFYGAYLLLGKFWRKISSPGAIAISIMVLISLIFFYLAATRGALLGLIAGVLVFVAFAFYRNRKWRTRAFVAEAILILVFMGMVFFKDTAFVKSLPGSRLFDISFNAETFQHRTIMWKTAWDGFKERPILGWGAENFIQVFDRHFNTKYYTPQAGFGAWFDRAHSVIFDYLAETGILGLLSYLSMFLVFYWLFFRSNLEEKPKYLTALVFALPIAYLVQGIILFDVLSISFNLFLFLAFSYFYFNNENKLKA